MNKEKEELYKNSLILAKEIKEVLESLDFPKSERLEKENFYTVEDFSWDEETEEEKREYIECVDKCLYDFLRASYLEEIALEEEKELEKLNGYSSYYFDDYFNSGRAFEEAHKHAEFIITSKTHNEILEMLKKEVE